MKQSVDLNVFLNPASVAVIGASEKPSSWGSFIMKGLLSHDYPGRIYPVNPNFNNVYGLKAYKDIRDIEAPVNLAVLTIPEKIIEKIMRACGQKGVTGVTIITAGFSEIYEQGKSREKALADLAHSFGMRLLGPNISGTFNLHTHFVAAAATGKTMLPTSLAGVCQGGYAFYDLLTAGCPRGMGVGKFIHTGNECDLTITDFLEHFGQDPEVEAILMYLETIRDSRRFIDVARKVTLRKPVVVYKAGKNPAAARAAGSHTGAMAGRKETFQGLLRQSGIINSPSMELLLPLGHALVERPPMQGRNVAIITVGGSWGVALTDSLEDAGLHVPELNMKVQKNLRELGLLPRASAKNPVDIGASGFAFDYEKLKSMAREILLSDEVDALILHGIGRAGMHNEDTQDVMKLFLEIEKKIILEISDLEQETGIPVLIGNHFTPWESQAVADLNNQGLRTYNRLDDIAQILALMYEHWRMKQARI